MSSDEVNFLVYRYLQESGELSDYTIIHTTCSKQYIMVY